MLLRYADRAGVGGIAPRRRRTPKFTPPPRASSAASTSSMATAKPAPLTYTHYARVVDQLGGMEMSDLLKGASSLLQGGEGRRRQGASTSRWRRSRTARRPSSPRSRASAVANAVCVGSLQQAPPSAGAKLTFSWAARAHFPCVAFK